MTKFEAISSGPRPTNTKCSDRRIWWSGNIHTVDLESIDSFLEIYEVAHCQVYLVLVMAWFFILHFNRTEGQPEKKVDDLKKSELSAPE